LIPSSAPGDPAAQDARQGGWQGKEMERGRTRIRLQLVNCDSLTSDRFVCQPAIEPSLGPKPRLQNLEEWPAACRKNHKKTAKESEA